MGPSSTPHRLAVVWAVAAAGCQLVGGYEAFQKGEPAEEQACSRLPTSKTDPLGLSAMVRVQVPGGACFWMDRTEVTVEQYRIFLSDVPADQTHWDPDWCRWKTVRSNPLSEVDDTCRAEVESFQLQPFAARKPMRCVDFCEAAAFCSWAGKRLCYDLGATGTSGPRGFPREWLLACTNAFDSTYPWGDDADAGGCNTGGSEVCLGTSATCGPVVVGQSAACTSAAGAADLIGNVSEWTFGCNFIHSSAPLEPTACLTRGGSYDEPTRACSTERFLSGATRSPNVGFRCCADLSSEEQALVY